MTMPSHAMQAPHTAPALYARKGGSGCALANARCHRQRGHGL